jgi:hypothetical protein
MAITKIKTTSSFTNLTKYDSFLAGNAAYNPSSYESIASQTLGSNAATVTFSSIPSTYQHLQIRCLVRSTTAATGQDALAIRLNSDTGTNYADHLLYGDGAAAAASGSASRSNMRADLTIPRNGNTANIFGTVIVDLHDYASTTKNKTIRNFGGQDRNGAGYISLSSGLWMNTSAVNTILLYPDSNSFLAGSTFALYGIKGA